MVDERDTVIGVPRSPGTNGNGAAAKMAKVAVVMPTHNRATLVRRAIESVFAQTMTEFELIVVDDGSTDETMAVLRAIEDERLKVIHLPRAGGACRARNLGVEEATADVVTFLDDDDEFLPDRLEKLLAAFDPRWAFVASRLIFIKPGGTRVKRYSPARITSEDLLYKTSFGISAMTDRRHFLSLGGFDESLRSSQDHDLWLRMTLAHGPGLCLREALMVVHTEHEVLRVSTSAGKIRGYRSFVRKHKTRMSRSHRAYHHFKLRSYATRSIPVRTLLSALPLRHWPDVLKYQLSRRLPGLRRIYGKFRG